VFGGGRMLLHIEEEHELPTPSTWMECSGIIFSTTTSNVSTYTLECGSKNVIHDETTGKSKSGDADCAKTSNVTSSNEKRNVFTSPTASTNVSSLEDQSSSWCTLFVPSISSRLN